MACHVYNLHLPLNARKAGTGEYTCILFLIWPLLTHFSGFFLSESDFRHVQNLLENSGDLNSLLEGVTLCWWLHSQTKLEEISQLKCGHFEPRQDWLPFPRQVVL